MTIVFVNAGSHKVDKIGVSHFDQGCDFPLEFLRQVVLAHILAIISKLEFLHRYVILFISRLEYISTGTCSNLLLYHDVSYTDPEMILTFLEFRIEDVTSLLSLCRLTGICVLASGGLITTVALLALLSRVSTLELLHELLVLLPQAFVFFLLFEHISSCLVLLLIENCLLL